MDFVTKLIEAVGSPTFGIVLTLLLIFQWYKQHAKDQAVKNSLFSMRRKVCRKVSEKSFRSEQDTAYDMVDDIDAILATLGSRKPFEKGLNKVINLIFRRNVTEDNDALIELKPERSTFAIPFSQISLKSLQSNNKNGNGKKKDIIGRFVENVKN